MNFTQYRQHPNGDGLLGQTFGRAQGRPLRVVRFYTTVNQGVNILESCQSYTIFHDNQFHNMVYTIISPISKHVGAAPRACLD